MKKTWTITAAMLIGAIAPAIASGQAFDVKYGSGGSIVDGTQTWNTNGKRYYAYVNGGSRKQFNVGMINLQYRPSASTSNWTQLHTYCIQPDQYLNLPNTYQLTDLDNSVANADGIERIWAAKYYDTVPTPARQDTSLEAAAFQTMIWEFTKDGDFNLASGSFKLDLNHWYTAQIADLASSWYTQMANWTEHASLAALVSGGSQNQIVAMPTPGAMFLGMSGLATVAGVTRRRRA
jgi:hypothetical protein